MRVNLSDIQGVTNHAKRNSIIDEMITASEEKKDPIFISDLLINYEQAEPILAALREDSTPKYRLLCMKDEWGNTPQPGDIVRRREKKPLSIQVLGGTVPIPSSELNQWKRAGIYDRKRYKYRDFVVDEKGCILVNAVDAEHFLSIWGIHSISGMPISYHPNETSKDVTTAPDGQKYHVWYWRYKEVDKEMYKNLAKPEKRNHAPRGVPATA
ncbi:MAG: hypothetical protein GWN94_18780 [Phycisphaerae bacterium]|nr:hypothetical protein [Phycisphaerae bacterium]